MLCQVSDSSYSFSIDYESYLQIYILRHGITLFGLNNDLKLAKVINRRDELERMLLMIGFKVLGLIVQKLWVRFISCRGRTRIHSFSTVGLRKLKTALFKNTSIFTLVLFFCQTLIFLPGKISNPQLLN
uniref:Uncharacterized protein n=1 Tax=Cacopsylla melanoneura TaxID=428564 RepID=A0A8D8R0Z2_9HEMI